MNRRISNKKAKQLSVLDRQHRQDKELIRNAATMMAAKMKDEHREQIQSRQGFTCPRPSRCRDYGKEYEEGSLSLFEKVIVGGMVAVVLILLAVYQAVPK